MWWSNTEQRKQQKEHIKNAIKRTQMTKKATQAQQQQPSLHGSSPPPPLSHSVPSSAEPQFAESFPHSRCSSGSPPSTGYDLHYATPEGYFAMPPPAQAYIPPGPYPMFSPYEVDIKTEHEIYVNNVATRKDSTISTFSTYQPPLTDDCPYPTDTWVQQEHFESTCEEFAEEPVDFNFFEYPHGPLTPNHETVIEVDDGDKYLLNHFLDKVTKLIFPVLDANQHGSARADVILPALESNKAYLHCCLSIAATHMKASEGVAHEQIDNDIVRHRYAAVSELCDALGYDTDHAQILEATLGMIFFQCSVGRPDDVLPDIPWHQHFQAATSLVQKLDLQKSVVDMAGTRHQSPFNMTLASWIDILGSTIIGRQPQFADTYRELNMSNSSLGLAELMGCDDRIMFLISEIACLDYQKSVGMDEAAVCSYVVSLGNALGQIEHAAAPVESCFSTTGAIRPKQLALNMTAVFTIAARIYLCTLVPGHSSSDPSMVSLVARFSERMNYIPAGPDGFDRSLAWPLLIAGSSSLLASPFRSMLDERCQRLGDAAQFGSFGRVRELLKDIWQINDHAATTSGDFKGIRWRDAIQSKGWDFLLI